MDSPGATTSGSTHRRAAAAARSPRYQPLVSIAAAAAAGIVVDRYARPEFAETIGALPTDASPTWVATWWLIAFAGLTLWWCARRARRDRLAAALLLVATSFTAAAWHDWQWYVFTHDEIARFAALDPEPAAVEVIARESPERVPAPRATPLRAIPAVERSRLLVDVVQVRDGASWRAASGVCQLGVNGHLLGVSAGDRLRVFGQLARVRPAMNPGEFDFAAHARSDRELTRINSSAPESITILDRGESWGAAGVLDRVRRHCERLVLRYVGQEEAGLASAILLGSRAGLPREETDPYFLTGTIHVLVVSGMNVGILTIGLLLAIRIGWLPRRFGLVMIGVVAVAYALLAEGQPPVMRAAVVAVLMSLAAWMGRPAAAFNSLAAAALFALALNPTDLFRVGPQLSFLAVATLIWIGTWPLLRHDLPTDRLDQLLAAARPWYTRLMSWASWRLIVALAIALIVWLAAVPLVVYRFNLVTPIAVLISPAVSVCIIFALYSGFIMLLSGDLLPSLADFAGAICAKSLASLKATVLWAESLPAGHFWSPGPTWWWLIGFYAGLLAVMLYGRQLLPPRWQIACLCGWIVIGLAPPLARTTMRSGLDCSFVSVGHGACAVLQTPGGKTLLYDAGSLGSPEFTTQSIAAYLWHRGITRIDGIVLSHADVDHYNAVPGLLERFHIGTIYVSPLMFDSFGEGAQRGGPAVLRAAIEQFGVPIREVWAGDRLRVDPDVAVGVLHPPRDGVLGSDNANSITLTVEYGGQRILLPGDLESPGIEDVMAELPYDCDVLLAPHHGSRRSDPPGFAAWSSPEWVVISGGGGNELQQVVDTYQDSGAAVLLSHERGAIEFAIQERQLHKTAWRNGK